MCQSCQRRTMFYQKRPHVKQIGYILILLTMISGAFTSCDELPPLKDIVSSQTASPEENSTQKQLETTGPDQSPTPNPEIHGKFQIGDIVKVINTLDQGLKIHKNSPTGDVLKIVPNGWKLKIIGGPQHLNERDWWLIKEEKYEPSPVEGWVAEDFLQEIPLESLIPNTLLGYFTNARDGIEQYVIKWAMEPERGNQDYRNLCLQFVANAFMQKSSGYHDPNKFITALGNNYFSSEDSYNPPRGALIFFSGQGIDEKTGLNYSLLGHIGIYLGNCEIVHAYGTVKPQQIAGGDGVESEYFIDSYRGWAYPPDDWIKNLRPAVYSYRTDALPAIDGVMSPGEWSGETLIKELSYTNSITGEEEKHSMFCSSVYDDGNLYIAIRVTNDDYQSGVNVSDGELYTDVLEIYFDSNNNGIIEVNEDIKNFWGVQYGDWHYSGNGGWCLDGTNNGSGVATHSNTDGVGDYTYEFKIPLNSGDPQDLSITSLSEIGIKISFREMYKKINTDGQIFYSWNDAEDGWPESSQQNRFEWSTYGKIVFVD